VRLNESTEKEGKSLYEQAIFLGSILKGRRQVCVGRKDFTEANEKACKEFLKQRIEVGLQIGKVPDFKETFQGIITEKRLGKELIEKSIDEMRLKDKTQWNPCEKTLQSLKSSSQQARSLTMLKNEFA